MAENSKIEWTDHTFNPWEGCTAVSPACDHCYAAARAARFKTVEWGAGKPRRFTRWANWQKPLTWNWAAGDGDRRDRVFCASLADVFDAEVNPEWRELLFGLIELTPNLDWLLLTKRPKIMAEYFEARPVPANVWCGTTAENQKMWDMRVGWLAEIGAAVRFVSVEPMLEPIDTGTAFASPFGPVDWVIAGPETGAGARSADLDWFRSLRDQCAAAGVPFFLKRATRGGEIPADLMVRQFPKGGDA